MMQERARAIAAKLEVSPSLKAVIGFDGYIDDLLRVVQQGDSTTGYTFFPNITSFADRLAEAAGKSADLEIVTTEVKLGGNAPIMSNALAKLGVKTTCIGAMGYPDLHPVFRDMAESCACISLCDPGYTNALEFDDGKVMLANLKSLERLTWANIKAHMGLDAIVSLFDGCDLISLVNWSGIAGAGDIWAGILTEVLPLLHSKQRYFFFDLADPSKKTAEEIEAVLNLIRHFSTYGTVILGMNKNEALRVSNAIGCLSDSPETAGQALYDLLQIEAVVIHPIDRCIAVTKDGALTEYGQVVEKPAISTGGGDNFNAGFCAGLLLGFELRDAMIMGMGTSGFYVKNGYSPSLKELAEHLYHWE